ncbi:DNA recombination protein RecO [Altererythrobacter xixiisoli]|uniref:DNA repair protein RecO n=1 Tax=Croceibacterium xixiisoli TaxID=1476466 RepID=A0A6I4TS76_9SPHN|nr:recombination protein O N-terminal domain-containing protein [Croceibacterium xixiisoli]MXO98806.1 DNA recombination protein RecO [Croceibacterium xixiisoli]
MQLRCPAILLAARAHGETAVIARLLTEDHGVVAAYVAGGRGRALRPVVIPGNRVELQLSARNDSQLPFARLELLESRAPWLAEPLPAAAISWACALTASALPERQAFPPLFSALDALLTAVCHAPSARGWITALVAYEILLLRELGYGAHALSGGGRALSGVTARDFTENLAALDDLRPALTRYLLAERHGDVMAARSRLRELLGRIVE